MLAQIFTCLGITFSSPSKIPVDCVNCQSCRCLGFAFSFENEMLK